MCPFLPHCAQRLSLSSDCFLKMYLFTVTKHDYEENFTAYTFTPDIA